MPSSGSHVKKDASRNTGKRGGAKGSGHSESAHGRDMYKHMKKSRKSSTNGTRHAHAGHSGRHSAPHAGRDQKHRHAPAGDVSDWSVVTPEHVETVVPPGKVLSHRDTLNLGARGIEKVQDIGERVGSVCRKLSLRDNKLTRAKVRC